MSSARAAARLASRVMRTSRSAVHSNASASIPRSTPKSEPCRPSQSSASPRMRCEEARRSYTTSSATNLRRSLLSQLPAGLRLALARQSSLLLFNWDVLEDA